MNCPDVSLIVVKHQMRLLRVNCLRIQESLDSIVRKETSVQTTIAMTIFVINFIFGEACFNGITAQLSAR